MRPFFWPAAGVLLIAAGLLAGTSAASGQCLGTETFKLFASDAQPDTMFGFTLAASGGEAVVLTFFDAPRAAYFFRDGETGWVEEVKLMPSSGGFNNAATIDSGFAAIGGTGGREETGSVFVYRYDGATWCEQVQLVGADSAAGDVFGAAVSLSGDTLLVGATGDDDNGADSGAAFVFQYDGVAWVQEAKLLPSDGSANQFFGSCVALSGDTAVVGCYWDSDRTGAAYVFRRDGAAWGEEVKLVASDGAPGDGFGNAIAVEGDVVIVGAPGDDENGYDSGSAYVFRFDGLSWAEEARLLPADGAMWDHFGESVDVGDGIAVVGMPRDDDNGNKSGSAYVFGWEGAAWVEQAKLFAADAEAKDFFGWSLGLCGETALVGVSRDDNNGDNAGSVCVFRGLSDCNENAVLDLCDIADGTSEDANGNGVPDECEPLGGLGDLNCDGHVDFDDINPMVLALQDEAAYSESFPDCTWLYADCNEDGVVNDADIAAFVSLLGTR